MRLINADTLKAEFTGNFNEMWHYTGIRAMIDVAPAVDAVEVVRCEDCKHYEIHKPKVLENCERSGHLIPMKPDDFCSYGERRTDGKDA